MEPLARIVNVTSGFRRHYTLEHAYQQERFTMEVIKQSEPTQREKDKDFIAWCIDMYLDGKVTAEGLVGAVSTIVKPNKQEEKQEA